MELIQLVAGLLAIVASAMSIAYLVYRIRRPPEHPRRKAPQIPSPGDGQNQHRDQEIKTL